MKLILTFVSLFIWATFSNAEVKIQAIDSHQGADPLHRYYANGTCSNSEGRTYVVIDQGPEVDAVARSGYPDEPWSEELNIKGNGSSCASAGDYTWLLSNQKVNGKVFGHAVLITPTSNQTYAMDLPDTTKNFFLKVAIDDSNNEARFVGFTQDLNGNSHCMVFSYVKGSMKHHSTIARPSCRLDGVAHTKQGWMISGSYRDSNEVKTPLLMMEKEGKWVDVFKFSTGQVRSLTALNDFAFGTGAKMVDGRTEEFLIKVDISSEKTNEYIVPFEKDFTSIYCHSLNVGPSGRGWIACRAVKDEIQHSFVFEFEPVSGKISEKYRTTGAGGYGARLQSLSEDIFGNLIIPVVERLKDKSEIVTTYKVTGI